jgi:O-antigen/teichoic acid export membrane protein
MKTHTLNFFKHSMIYGSSIFLNRAVLLIMMPLYIRYLSVEQYGKLEILNITSTLIILLMQMGLGSAIFRSVLYQPQKDNKIIISTSFYFLILMSTIQLVFLLIFSSKISFWMFKDLSDINLFRIIAIVSFCNIFSIIPLAVIRMSNRSLLFSLISFISFIFEISLNIVFLIKFKLGIHGILLAMLIKSFVFMMVYVYLIKNELIRKFSIGELKEMIKFGFPLVPSAIFFTVMSLTDRYFLNLYTNLGQVGIYTFGYRIGLIISLVINAFQIAWPSILFTIAREKNAKEKYASIFTCYFAFLTLIGLILSIFSKDIVNILGTQAYQSSSKIIPFITTSYIFMGIYYMTSIGIQIKKKTIFEPIVMLVPMILNIIMNNIFIPKFGIIGAATVHTISFVLLGGLAYLLSNHFYKINYQFKKIILIGISALILFFISQRINLPYIYLDEIIKCLLILIFILLMLRLKIHKLFILKE